MTVWLVCHVLSSNPVRLYDVNTVQCFVSANARDQHTREITSVSCPHMTVHNRVVILPYPLPQQVHYTPDARMYCSSSDDGAIKVNTIMCTFEYVSCRVWEPGMLAHTHTRACTHTLVVGYSRTPDPAWSPPRRAATKCQLHHQSGTLPGPP